MSGQPQQIKVKPVGALTILCLDIVLGGATLRRPDGSQPPFTCHEVGLGCCAGGASLLWAGQVPGGHAGCSAACATTPGCKFLVRNWDVGCPAGSRCGDFCVLYSRSEEPATEPTVGNAHCSFRRSGCCRRCYTRTGPGHVATADHNDLGCQQPWREWPLLGAAPTPVNSSGTRIFSCGRSVTQRTRVAQLQSAWVHQGLGCPRASHVTIRQVQRPPLVL